MNGINKCYTISNVFVVSLGFMQFGMGMCSFTNTADAWTRYFDWNENEVTLYTDMF